MSRNKVFDGIGIRYQVTINFISVKLCNLQQGYLMIKPECVPCTFAFLVFYAFRFDFPTDLNGILRKKN